MFILIALVAVASQPDPIVLKGNTRFPTEAQCEKSVEPAKQALSAQIAAIGKVIAVRCIKTDDQDI